MTEPIKLPPLPEWADHTLQGEDRDSLFAWAEAAIEADRQARGEPVAYHPSTPILIDGLKRLTGGAAVLSAWDKARAQVDAPHPASPELDVIKGAKTYIDLIREVRAELRDWLDEYGAKP